MEFGIGYLELQFASVIGNSIYAKNLPSHGRNFEFSNLPVQLDPQGIEFEQPEKDVVPQNLISSNSRMIVTKNLYIGEMV